MSKPNQIYNPKWNSYIELWQGIQPPWRPNQNQLDFYLKYLKKYLIKQPKPKVLIFGSTPETRDICAKLKLNVTCFDANEGMYYGMKKMMRQDPKKEKFIQGKWENTDQFFQKEEFDIVFSDETQVNMVLKDWGKNFRDINIILKKNGFYFFSTMVANLDQKITFEKVFKKYQHNPKFFRNFQNQVDIFYSLLANYSFNSEARAYAFHDLKEKLKAYASRNQIESKVLGKIWPIQGDIKKEILGNYIEVDPTVGEIYELLFPYFYVEDFYIDSSHSVYRLRRDMVLRPKK
ncbi:MAG: methyltransferase domain-containing protein [Candidatus Doudnabacteria bacterium]